MSSAPAQRQEQQGSRQPLRNNVDFHVEWYEKEKSNNNNSTDKRLGFHYSILEDGSCFAEQLHRERIPGFVFVPTPPTTAAGGSGMLCFSHLERMVEQMALPQPPSRQQSQQHRSTTTNSAPLYRQNNWNNSNSNVNNFDSNPATTPRAHSNSSRTNVEIRNHFQSNTAGAVSQYSQSKENKPQNQINMGHQYHQSNNNNNNNNNGSSKMGALDLIHHVDSNFPVGTKQQSHFTSFDYRNGDDAPFAKERNNIAIAPRDFAQFSPPTNSGSWYSGGSNSNNNNFDTFNNNAGGSDANVPCCPQHNIPCRILTSNTAANPGRQFYKCSLPNESERCDFFEWADKHQDNGSGGGGGGGDGGGFGNGGWTSGGNNYSYQDSSSGFASYTSAVSGGQEQGVLDVHAENRRKFGHASFRPGQEQIIQNALQGRDVFVLMPTGGGKSLCYQLPAWCCPGLAVIISPLLSLIQDQVQSLTKLGVPSVFLSSSQDYETEQREIIGKLFNTTAHGGIKLLYITPEKLRHSNLINNVLRKLHDRKLLSRFVIDEAHCLSDWGHDFRPDYNQLGRIRREFPGVPLMALTATANKKVVDDAIRALQMSTPYLYKSSFNRPNLHYEVRKKTNKSIDEIAEYIAHRRQHSGVIYCLSRRDTENVSEKLQSKLLEQGHRGVSVSFYHAELDDRERARRHHAWSMGQINVLCATVAFGMGIDKPDVRYVLHYSLPKSITHYYQESGRAGRDGQKADCILYYAYKDKKVLETMIRKSSNHPGSQSTRRKIDQLYTCLRYCENDFLCRRTLQLEFFGESFDRSKCSRTCDNCRAGRIAERRDQTAEALAILRLLQDCMQRRRVTMVQLMELYRGSKAKTTTRNLDTDSLTGYGAGKKFTKAMLDRIAHSMVFEKILAEEAQENMQGFTSDYVQPGEQAGVLQAGQRRFFVDFPKTVSASASDHSKNKNSSSSNNKSKSRSTAQNKKNITPTAAAATTKKKKRLSGTTTKRKRSPKKASAAGDGTGAKRNLSSHFDNTIEIDSDQDGDEDFAAMAMDSSSAEKGVLPKGMASQLAQRLKKLSMAWAEEEQLNGNKVFYWNIISTSSLNMISTQIPTTIEELKGLGVLGENIITHYGERLLRAINSFVSGNNLQQFVKTKNTAKPETHPTKKQKAMVVSETPPACATRDDDDDMSDGFYDSIPLG